MTPTRARLLALAARADDTARICEAMAREARELAGATRKTAADCAECSLKESCKAGSPAPCLALGWRDLTNQDWPEGPLPIDEPDFAGETFTAFGFRLNPQRRDDRAVFLD